MDIINHYVFALLPLTSHLRVALSNHEQNPDVGSGYKGFSSTTIRKSSSKRSSKNTLNNTKERSTNSTKGTEIVGRANIRIRKDSREPYETDTEHFNPRRVLLPNQALHYKVRFIPTTCGSFSKKITIEMTGWAKKYFINCKGSADIPCLNFTPEMFFGTENVMEAHQRSTKFISCMYIKNLNTYNFGPQLINKYSKQSLKGTFNLINSSLLPCEVNVDLKEHKNAFDLLNSMYVVLPNETKILTVSSMPDDVTSYEDQLVFSIKNNPKIQKINLKCTGTTVQFYVDPHIIVFERTVANRVDRNFIYLHNKSIIKLHWMVETSMEVSAYYKINPLKGTINPCSKSKIELQFSPNDILSIPNYDLIIKVYEDDVYEVEPIFTEIVTLSAEISLVKIEALKQIHFGEIKARKLHKCEYSLANLGSYDLEYTVEYANDEKINKKVLTEEEYCKRIALHVEHEKIRKMFKLKPISGMLKRGKLINLKLHFFPNKALQLKKLPVFEISCADPTNKKMVILYQLEISATCFVSSYRICPDGDVNFGFQLVGTTTAKEITVRNTGKLDFSYTVLSTKKLEYQKIHKTAQSNGQIDTTISKSKSCKKSKFKGKANRGEDSIKSYSSKKSSKITNKGKIRHKGSSKMSKSNSSKKSSKITNKGKIRKKGSSKKSKGSAGSREKERKTKSSKIDIGIFTVMPSNGIIHPKETATINITCHATKFGLQEETAIIFITECPMANRNGTFINLLATGAVPNVNFSSAENIFMEQYVVNSFADMSRLEQVDSPIVYVKEENTIHFRTVCINTTVSTRLKFVNEGFVTATLDSRIIAGSKFTVTPETVCIATQTCTYINVLFTPDILQVCEGTLEVTYEVPTNIKKKYFRVNLHGDGCVPEIKIIEPPIDNGIYKMAFDPLLLECVSSKQLSFKNIGTVPCKLLLEIVDDVKDNFSIISKPNTRSKIVGCNWEVLENTKHSKMMTLIQKDISNMVVQFSPSRNEGRYNCTLKIHLLNNPFDMFEILISAESYSRNIIIEELPTILNTGSILSKDLANDLITYQLDFGYCYLNKLLRKNFKIMNISPVKMYRFEFTTYDKLVFAPTIGHLKPGARKEIIASFLTKEPVTCTKINQHVTADMWSYFVLDENISSKVYDSGIIYNAYAFYAMPF